MFRLFTCVALGWLVFAGRATAEPLATKYLYEGKLAQGEKALLKHLKDTPKDDEARFGLGVIQFLRAFEKLGESLYKHGLKTGAKAEFVPPPLRAWLPENPKPEEISYEAFRNILIAFVADLEKAEATLAEVKDDKVKLPLHVGRIRLDLFGQGKPFSAAMVFGALEMKEVGTQVEKFVIGFDRADVSWFRGYMHLLMAGGEFMLAVDGKEVFETTAHRFFEKVKTPHAFLLEEDREIRFDGDWRRSVPAITDAIAFIHGMIALPVKEPARMKAVMTHLQGMITQGKEMWTHILAETDDDNEWIPSPRQKGVLGVAVNKEMIDSWLQTLNEAEQILAGKKLLPFWRGKGGMGVNLRKAFLNPPKKIDILLWVQGTAATPYLEKGTITALADPKTIDRLDRVFGGARFFGFAFWFN